MEVCLACDKTKNINLEPRLLAVVTVTSRVFTSCLIKIDCNHYFIISDSEIALEGVRGNIGSCCTGI